MFYNCNFDSQLKKPRFDKLFLTSNPAQGPSSSRSGSVNEKETGSALSKESWNGLSRMQTVLKVASMALQVSQQTACNFSPDMLPRWTASGGTHGSKGTAWLPAVRLCCLLLSAFLDSFLFISYFSFFLGWGIAFLYSLPLCSSSQCHPEHHRRELLGHLLCNIRCSNSYHAGRDVRAPAAGQTKFDPGSV
jgi:hypothetical protein